MVMHMIGNAHLDPVWLWNWEAGADEAVATFRSAADRCEEYPEFHYTRGEAWLYEIVELLDPVLFQRVLRAIKRGQWHATGGQYVQPDANLPTEPGWHRQLAVGLEYFQRRLRQRPTIGYNVDSFGHPATLPDILAAHGMRGYVFHRPNETQQALPGMVFRWRGPRGGEVVGYRIAPCYVTRTDDLYGQIMSVLDVADPEIGHAMCFYGLGNHGGGPSKATIEYIRENREAFPGVVLEFSHPERYFDAIVKRKATLPVYEGELQHTFPGCYSVMHDIKQAQHRTEYRMSQAEHLLENLELPAAFRKKLAEPIAGAWKDLLFAQFHDILAGTSIDGAWPSVRAKQGRALAVSEDIALAATRRWARAKLPAVNHQQIVVVNSEPFDFDGLVQFEPYIDFDDWGVRWLSSLEGKPLRYQLVSPEANMGPMTHAVAFPVKVPAGGHAMLLLRDDPHDGGPNGVGRVAQASSHELLDGATSVKLGSSGLKRIQFKGRDILRDIGIRLVKDSSDTWVFHSDRFANRAALRLEDLSWKVEETGPLRARAYAEGRLGDSTLRWTVELPAGANKVILKLEVHFREKYRLMRLDLGTPEQVTHWHAGLPGGSVTRVPDRAEWPIQKWLASATFGIVTPDAYSVNHSDRSCAWTLLRAPLTAWAGQIEYPPGSTIHHTDQGVHRFEFHILLGAQERSRLDAEHRFMVCPPIIFDRYEGMNRPPWGNQPPRRLWTPDIPRARQDGRLMDLPEGDSKNWEEPH